VRSYTVNCISVLGFGLPSATAAFGFGYELGLEEAYTLVEQELITT
jgi:hypothetical protein